MNSIGASLRGTEKVAASDDKQQGENVAGLTQGLTVLVSEAASRER